MKRILLIRHGETFQNREQVVQGADPTQGRLTEGGVRQAALLGQALAGHPFEMVYCSPLERAVLTLAQVLLARNGERTLPLCFAEQLQEINVGRLHGKSHLAWREAIGEGDPMAFTPEGGESWLDVQRRTGAFFREVILPSPHREILVVAHGGVTRGILATVLGLTMAEMWREVPQHNGCINTLEFDGKGQLAGAFANDTRHLAPDFPQAAPGRTWLVAERRWQVAASNGGDGAGTG